LVASMVAGRLSSHVPVRWLIGPGLVLVGIGLVLMAGLNGQSPWTDLIPGFIVAGIGGGLVNPPLASTAVGVVTPARAGRARGATTPFPQLGLATGTAALGSSFSSPLRSTLAGTLSGPPLVRGGGEIAAALQQGKVARLFGQLPPSLRPRLGAAI